MNRRRRCCACLACLLVLVTTCAFGQKAGAGAQAVQQGGQSGQATQGSGLQGLSFTPSQWPYMDLPNPKDPDFSFGKQGRVVLCYRLAKGNSATQPFVLEPIASDDVPYSGFERPCGEKSEGSLADGDLEGQYQCKHKKAGDDPHWTPCAEFQKNPPALKANQTLVVGIDISSLGEAGPDTKLELTGPNQNQLKLFNINVTNQQGSPLNPAPVRASFPSTSASGGVSGQAPSNGILKIVDTSGNGSEWTYIGTKAPSGTPWLPDHAYINGDIVSDATGKDFYRLSFKKPPAKNDCSIANLPVGTKEHYCSGARPNDPFPVEQTADRIIDNEVVWQEMSAPSTNTISNSFTWERNHDYLAKGVVVCVLRGKNDRVSEASNEFYSFKSDDEKKCSSKQRRLDKGKDEHLHYYFAVKGGRSGGIPKDPFSVDYLPRVIYLPWPYLLPGDAVPTFNVNLVYTPPTPGAPWQGNMFYPAGSVVTPGTSNGHYYTALTGGFSDLEPNEPNFPAADPYKDRVHDGSLYWLDSGTSVPSIPPSPGAGSSPSAGGAGAQGNTPGGPQGSGQAGKPMLWMPLTHFSLGDTVIRPESGHYFAVVKSDSGLSGVIPTNANGGQPRKDPFPPQAPAASSYIDGQIEWTEASSACTQCTPWQANHLYSVVQGTDPATHAAIDNEALIGGVTYLMTSSMSPSGKSGGNPAATRAPKAPFIGRTDATTPVTDNQVEWRFVPSATSSQAWQAGTPYSIGQLVCDDSSHLNANNCAAHSFVVDRVLAGTSGLSDPSAQPITTPPVTVQDGDVIWTPVPGPVAQQTVKTWAAQKPFTMGDIVHADNRLYYKAIRFTGGISGNDEKAFQITRSCTVVDPVIKIKDNSVQWQDMGTLRPRTPLSCLDEPYNSHLDLGALTNFENWEAVHSHGARKDTVIFEPGEEGGRYYKAITEGATGKTSPFLNITPPLLITWQDSGTTAPPSVALGQPADQTVSLINLTLPQTHSLARFNVAAGAGVTFFNRPPTFGWALPTASQVTLPTSPITVPSNSAVYQGTNAYYVPASLVTVPNTAMTASVPIATTVPTSGTGTPSLSVEPHSQCTYGSGPPLADTTPDPHIPGTAGAKLSSPIPVFPVYECAAKTGSGTRPVDALLVLSAYIWPVDEEVPWRGFPWRGYGQAAWRDWLPAPSFAISLINPASDFYLGGSSEFLVRNLQVFYAWPLLNQQSRLATYSSQQVWGGQGTAPTVATIPTIRHGMFIGVTFNLSNFISSLFGGGGGAK